VEVYCNTHRVFAASELDSSVRLLVMHEKGWRKVSYLKNQRFDLILSMVGLFVMLAMVQVAAAGALMPRGIQVKNLEDLIPMFTAVIVDAGAVLLGATLWGIIFYRYVGSGTAYGIMISDVYHRFIRPSPVIEKQDHGPGACHLPAYRWLVVYIFLSPLYVFLTDWTPIGLVIVKSALSVIGLPVIVFMLARLTADRKVMGEEANSLLRNALLILTLAAAVYVSYQGVGDMLAGKDAS
jgi:Mn2+/Fe2+ NRAMP family transporter